MDEAHINGRPDPGAVSLIPEAIARTLRVAPISAAARTLTIAVAAPLSGQQLGWVIETSGRQLVRQIEPGPEVVAALIESAYGS